MTNVGYANARAKSLENNLLKEERINRMIESATPDDALKILAEVNFGDGITLNSALDFENLISAEKKKLFAFIRESSPNQAFSDFLLLKSDFHNAEALIRAKHLKIDAEEFLDVSGKYDIEKMRELILEDDYSSFPKELSDALTLADIEFVEGKATGTSISSAFCKAYYSTLYKLSKKNPVLTDIYNVKADASNIGVALRLRDYSSARSYFVTNGKFSDEELKIICEEQLEGLKDRFKFCYISELIGSAIDCAVKGQPLSEFEKDAESFAVNRMLKQKYETSGAVPFMQYCYYKSADLTNIRIIMVGLINGLNKTDIKNRLRAYYER